MMERYNKTVIAVLLVLSIIFVVAGTTFAFFSASANVNGDNIGGSTYTFNVNLNVTAVKSGNLIPVMDDLIDDTLASNNVCVDARSTNQKIYNLCSLYQITLTNSGSPETLVGYLTKGNATTYTTNNLKYQLYTLNNGTYTAISDVRNISITTTNNDYFKSGNNNVEFSLPDGTTSSQSRDYYLVIWLSDTSTNQTDDINKTFSGTLTFTSVNGNNISADFS